MACRERDKLGTPGRKERVGADQERVGPLPDGGDKRGFEVALGAGLEGDHLLSGYALPPAGRPSIPPISSSRDQVVPCESEKREQQRADADRHHEEAPGHVVYDHHQWINSSRRVKRASETHHGHCETDCQCRGPRRRSAKLDDEQADERGNEVAAGVARVVLLASLAL